VLPVLLPQLSVYAGRTLVMHDINLKADDARENPDFYSKLFEYLEQVKGRPDLLNKVITIENKEEYRTLLQWVGGYFLYRLNTPTLWYQALQQYFIQIPGLSLVAITSPRQPAEADFVRQLGGSVIMVERPGISGGDRNDVTERRVEEIQPDCAVVNSADIVALEACSQQIYQDLLNGNLQTGYDTSNFRQ
jgi:hypothetical protein